ncbi:MAG: helix-turn-helix transcriptional regulator [Eubacteriales bacterium]
MTDLYKLRKQKGLTQADMAKILGIAQQTYGNYEKGNRQPSLEMLVKLADSFEVTVDYLLGREMPTCLSTDTDNVSLDDLFMLLDDIDKAEIRGEIKGMLRAEKYALNSREKRA